jgi:tetrahydromethanopterin S-methyltransferase subunit C
MDGSTVLPLALNLIGILTALALVRYAWQHHPVPGAKFFAIYMMAAVIWAASALRWSLEIGAGVEIEPGRGSLFTFTLPAAG